MAIRDIPSEGLGLNKAQLIQWYELEIASNLYDDGDLAVLQEKLTQAQNMLES